MIIARAPLRISFFGGGTDFPEHFRTEGGAVLSTAIDKFSYVTASAFRGELFDYALKVSYSRNETVAEPGQIEHPVFRECLRLLGLERNIELHAVADLPAFTGLGSSSTFTVALLQALHAYKGETVSPIQLAYEAIHVERGRLGESVGCQDQVAAALGGFNVVEFRTETDIAVHPLAILPQRREEIERHILIAYTGRKRRAADIEAKKVKTFAQNRDTLRRMRQLVDQGRDALLAGGSLETFGRLLHESWLAKRSLEAAVSNDEIDTIYRLGIEGGAWGGKLLGAGGGGFVLFVAPPERHAAIRRNLARRFFLDCRLGAPGVQVIFDENGTPGKAGR